MLNSDQFECAIWTADKWQINRIYEQVKHGLQLVFQWDGKDVDTNINEMLLLVQIA